jgi:16S rRNA processing protein RimM
MPSRQILVGVFGRPHGVRGEIKLISYTAEPMAILSYAPLADRAGTRTFTLLSLRPAGRELIARVKGVTDRDAAAALTRTELYVPRERLPDGERGEGEYFVADLVGMAAVSESGEPLGRVVAVPNYGAGDILEIAPDAGGETLLLPFAEPYVGTVDLSARRLVVRPPVDGEPS